MASRPFTLPHFRAWAKRLILDNGKPWLLESFQAAYIADLLAGYRECWLIVPEGNGKTTLVSGVALYYLEHKRDPSIPVAASSRDQARQVYKQAEGFVLRSEWMHDLVPDPIREARGKRAKDVPRFTCQEGFRRIKHFEGGEMQIMAADASTGDGVIPDLCVIDEMHRHRNLDLLRTWAGKLDKKGGQLAGISTAGEPGSDFEETRERILREATEVTERGPHIRAVSGDVVLHDWAVRDRGKASDMRTVAAANPRKAITAGSLRRKRSKPTMTDEHWQRFVCNIATRLSGQAIKPEEWDALEELGLEPDRAARCWGWLDLGWKIDTTAMGVLIWESFTRRVIAGTRVIEPPVDERVVVAGLLDLQEEFLPEGFVYDPNAGGRQMAQQLERGDHPLQLERDVPALEFIEHSQDPAPMATAASRLDEAIRAGWLVHDGDRTLRAHALNAARHGIGGEKWRYDRPADAKGERRGKFPIDALTGVSMGHSVACTLCEEPEEKHLDLSSYRIGVV